nr:carbohydrate kinase [uncultured Oscillibacter sp.]
MHITALGEILIDYTPLQTDCSDRPVFEQNPGGAPANVLACAAKLGRQTAFLGKVGSDLQGRFLVKCLEDAGIDTRGVIVDANCFTTLAFVTLSETGERSFAFARKPGADTQLWSTEVDTARLRETDIFHIGSLSLTDEPARSATHYAILAARNSGTIISYDPNYRPLLWPDEETAARRMRSVLPDVDIVKCSDEETALLTGEADPEAAVRQLVANGIPCAVVTLGADGALAATREGVRHVPGFASHVVDTTGAGDAFWGGVLTCLSESGLRPEAISLDQLEQFVRFGNAVASLCVEKRGAIPAMPEREQVLARLAQG